MLIFRVKTKCGYIKFDRNKHGNRSDDEGIDIELDSIH